MMRIRFSILFLVIAGSLFAQNSSCRIDTEGTDFWFGFMESRNYQPEHLLKIIVTSNETTTFQLTTGPDEIPFNGPYTVNANQSVQIEIPWQLVEATGSETVQDKGIHLTSEKPVTVYALNWAQNTADVAMIYPVGALGKEYYTMCYTPAVDTNPEHSNGRNSEFLIVATEDETMVQITPSRVTDKGRPNDIPFTIKLNKGQVYQVQSENIAGSHLEGQGDLTGSYILADKPVAVYSGSLSTQIPNGQCCWDHLYEQIPPVQSWGSEYYLTPLKSRFQDRYRIMAAHDNTTVHVSGRTPFTIDRGKFEEIVVFHDDPKQVVADKPVMIAQFSQSRNVDINFTGGDGDPFMIILHPVTHLKNEATFVAIESPELDAENYQGITKDFVSIICPTTEISNIRFNGEAIPDSFQVFPGGEYAFARVSIEKGNHHITNVNEAGGFQAYVYGFGGLESYGYSAGFSRELTLDLGESNAFRGDTLLLCYGDSLILDAGYTFETWLWSTGATSRTITIADPGWVHIQTTAISGCLLEDSVYIYLSRPVADIGPDLVTECAPFKLELTAPDGYPDYLWQNIHGDALSHDQTFFTEESGHYILTVFDRYQCASSDTMELILHPVPEVTFSGESPVCGIKSATLSVSVHGTPDSVWNFNGSTQWSVCDPSSLTLIEIDPGTVQLEAADWGDYEVCFNLRTIDGCERTDTFFIRFHPQPEPRFVIDSDEQCEGYSQILRFTGTATDSAAFHWDLNGSVFLDTLGWQNYLVSVGAFLDDPPYISLTIDDNGCVSETLTQPTGANPNVKMEASRQRGCDELTVEFNATLLTEDAVDYLWEFDDGETSAQSALAKHYPEPGTYGVKLTVTNPVTACRNSFSLDDMIKVFPTPTAAISADPTLCHPDTIPLIYPYAIDSSLIYWEFEGMHQTGGENDSITVRIDTPFASVRLTVDEYGCVSEPFDLQVKRKPRFDFYTASTEVCLPFIGEVFTETEDNELHFEWFTPGLPHHEGASRVLSFNSPGKKNVTVIARSDETGCSDTLVKPGWIEVYPKPVADFRVNYQTAVIDDARIRFFNRSGSGLLYYWNFGDGSFSTEAYPAHTYSEPGEYIAELITESADGCRDTLQIPITILPSKLYTPNAFRPGSPISENRTFMPLNRGINPARFSFQVYDRNGQLVFESESPRSPWNGNLPNGNPAPMGNYVWTARYFDIQGFERLQQGQVLLIR